MIFVQVFLIDIDLWFSILGMLLSDFGIRVLLENKGILEVSSIQLFPERVCIELILFCHKYPWFKVNKW